MNKQSIPKAVREQVWLKCFGKRYEAKCLTHWCTNTITVFDFHCGHDIPESKGGPTILSNLYPICSRCNLSMSNNYTFSQWNNTFPQKWNCFKRYLCCCIRWTPYVTVVNGTESIQSHTNPNAKHPK